MENIRFCRYALREVMKMQGSREQWLSNCPAIADSREGRRWVGCREDNCQYYSTIEESLEMWAKAVLENWTRTGVAYGSRGWSPGAFPSEAAADEGPPGKEAGPDG